MAFKTLEEKLAEGKGSYTFDFTKEEDCQYLFQEYGGEENMKKNFPRAYEAFEKARRDGEIRRSLGGEEAASGNTFSGEIGKLTVADVKKTTAGRSASSGVGKLKTELSCNFIDGTKEVCDEELAEEWKGIAIQVKIKEKNFPRYILNKNIVVESAHQYHKFLYTGEGYISEFNHKKYDIRIDLTGLDPGGKLNKQILTSEISLGNVEAYNIYNVEVDDPAAKNGKHQSSGEIIMLYGRENEQKLFADADYKGGDYYNNTFSNGKVHLLLPLKGDIVLDYKVVPQGLKKPDEGECLSRPEATYDYKQQSFTYRADLDDNQLYDKMKNCFTQESYREGVRTKVHFDLRIPDGERSDLDWHQDVKGIQNGEPKTIMLDARFTYLVKNSLGVEGEEQITIASRKKDFMKEIEKEYYEFDRGTNTVYIPPITIYWGCFAGDVLITMADGSQKAACDIGPGDLVLGYGNQKLTVEEVVKGEDKTIFSIETKEHGAIRVSGGHPMMCEGALKRAAAIMPGDMLDLADGGTAEVMKAEEAEYGGTVYNFTFAGEEEGVWLIANGFYSGDLRMQNKKKEQKKTCLTQEEKEFVEEMKAFYRTMEEEPSF